MDEDLQLKLLVGGVLIVGGLVVFLGWWFYGGPIEWWREGW